MLNQSDAFNPASWAAAKYLHPHEVLIPAWSGLRRLRQMQQTGAHCRNFPCHVLLFFPQVGVQCSPRLPQGPIHLVQKVGQAGVWCARSGSSEAHFGEERVHGLDISDAVSDGLGQGRRHDIEVWDQLGKRLGVAMLSINARHVVVTGGPDIPCQHAASPEMEKLDPESDIGNAGDRPGVVSAREHRCEPKGYRRHGGAYSPQSGPSIPPHNTPGLARRPARTNSVPPAHSMLRVWISAHSATDQDLE